MPAGRLGNHQRGAADLAQLLMPATHQLLHIDFGTAGTIARLTAAGAEVVYALVTSGEAVPTSALILRN